MTICYNCEEDKKCYECTMLDMSDEEWKDYIKQCKAVTEKLLAEQKDSLLVLGILRKEIQ